MNLLADESKPTKLFSNVGVVLLTVLMIGLFLTAQLVGVYLFTPMVFNDSSLSLAQRYGMGSFDGTVISYAMLFTLVVMITAIFGIVHWRIKQLAKATPLANIESARRRSPHRKGVNTDINRIHDNQQVKVVSDHHRLTLTHYLGIKLFSIKVGLGVLGMWFLFVIFSEVISYVLNKDSTAFVDELFISADPQWLLILVIVIIAPIYEELIFRGILWSALKEQIEGAGGVWFANLVTSIVFAIIHLQYDVYEMGVIFVLSLLLGYARARSGSLFLPILVHIINNGVTMWVYVNA